MILKIFFTFERQNLGAYWKVKIIRGLEYHLGDGDLRYQRTNANWQICDTICMQRPYFERLPKNQTKKCWKVEIDSKYLPDCFQPAWKTWPVIKWKTGRPKCGKYDPLQHYNSLFATADEPENHVNTRNCPEEVAKQKSLQQRQSWIKGHTQSQKQQCININIRSITLNHC